MPSFATLDLNLLRVFDALYEEHSATRAGDRLGLTQSAVSHALARLRDFIGDELFVRTSEGMVPTPRAHALAPRVRRGLLEVQSAFQVDAFAPDSSDRRFVIAANPYACAVLLPELVAVLRSAAPGASLRVRPVPVNVVAALDAGRLDLAIAQYGRAPDRLEVEPLLQEQLVWAMRADHPLAAGPLTLERLADVPHLVRGIADEDQDAAAGFVVEHGVERRVVQDDATVLGLALARIGRERTVRVTMPDSNAALAAVGRSDMAALVPKRLALAVVERYGLVLFDPPYDSPPITVSMLWHRGNGAHPATEWLRAQLRLAARRAL